MSLKLQVRKFKKHPLGINWAARVTLTHVGDGGDWVFGATKSMALKKLYTKLNKLANKLNAQLYRTSACGELVEEAIFQAAEEDK